MHDVYADQIDCIHPLSKPDRSFTDQFAPAINMVQIHQLSEDSILPIFEEEPGVESEGFTKTVTKTITDILTETPSPPRRFPGELFMISYDSPP